MPYRQMNCRPWVAVAALAAALDIAGAAPAFAGPEDPSHGGIPPDSIATSLPHDGDPGGARRWLAERGLRFALTYTGEALGTVLGGQRRGGLYEAKLEAAVDLDLETMLGWRGLSAFVNAFQIHGTGGPGRDLLGNLNASSNIEALPSSRLSELWLEQKLLDDRLGLRVGQLTADAEFFISDYAVLFPTSGWPAIAAADLPGSGPAYPLSTPGLRLRIDATKQASLLVAAFNGDPAGPGETHPQRLNHDGTNFRLGDPAFLISELQYRYNQERDAAGLAGAVRFGAWRHFGRFDDQRLGSDGLSLADPASNGIAARLRGNSGFYGVIDQQIHRPPGGGADSGIAVYGRVSASPADRNLISYFMDGGATVTGPFAARPDDVFGVGLIYSRISADARALDRDRIAFGAVQPVRSHELTLELTYQARILPGWTIQPDIQYIVHPGGNIADPARPGATSAIKDALILGLRSAVKY